MSYVSSHKHWTPFSNAKIIRGDVIEVGLGEGMATLSIADETRVSSYTAYERDGGVVQKFRDRNPEIDPKINIFEEDFLKARVSANQYDIGLIDVFDSKERAIYDNAKLIIQRLRNTLKPGAKIIVEYVSGYNQHEARFRKFMEREFGPMQTEFIRTGNPSTSRHIAYYEVS
jgi:spermidine synthase